MRANAAVLYVCQRDAQGRAVGTSCCDGQQTCMDDEDAPPLVGCNCCNGRSAASGGVRAADLSWLRGTAASCNILPRAHVA